MDIKEVYKNLCYYDIRNPDCNDFDIIDTRAVICFCDNCFHGNHKMAIEIIRLKRRLKANQIINKINREENKS